MKCWLVLSGYLSDEIETEEGDVRGANYEFGGRQMKGEGGACAFVIS